MTATLPEDQRLIEISARAFEHPADRAATAALKSIPMLDRVVRLLSELGYERAFRSTLMASSVRIDREQLPTAYADHVAAYARLDLDPVPDLFVTQFPVTNAAAVGAGKPFVIVNSAALNLFDEGELRTVLGHEAGHVLAEHVMYRTALMMLLSLTRTPLGMLAGLPLVAVRLALLEWFRAAELSADRAATLVTRDPMATCRTLMVMGSGVSSDKMNLDAFIRQGTEYRDVEGWDKLARMRSGAVPDAPVRGQARARADEVGPVGRLRPHPRRRVRQARAGARRARGGRRGHAALQRALQGLLRRCRGERRQGGRAAHGRDEQARRLDRQALSDYDALAAVYDEHLAGPAGAAPFVGHLPPGARVLDCACGTGLVAADLIARGFDVAASDASPGMVARARERGVPAEVRRWEELPEGDFDATLCVGNSLAHARDRGPALRGMAGTLKPGGLLLVTSRDWETETSRTEHDGAVHRCIDVDARPAVITVEVAGAHARLEMWPFTRAELSADLRAAGLEPEALEEAGGRYLLTARTSRAIVDPRA